MHTHIFINGDLGLHLVIRTNRPTCDFVSVLDRLIVNEVTKEVIANAE